MLLLSKNREVEGFHLADPSKPVRHEKYFTDTKHKILLDNTAPYGHFITGWLYSALKTLEDPALSPKNTLILIYLSSNSPDLTLEHMATITAFVADRFRRRGYQVEYIETETFYVTNLYGPLLPPHVQDMLLPGTVRSFLIEETTTSSYGQKIYLSRRKTTTSNSRQLSRIDDEALLEAYLESLGFEVIFPEDFSSYQDQLNKIASARILASITSSALYSALVLPPESKVVEFCTIPRASLSQFPDHYRSVALVQGNTYVSIPNLTLKAQDIIDYIENKPELILLLS